MKLNPVFSRLNFNNYSQDKFNEDIKELIKMEKYTNIQKK